MRRFIEEFNIYWIIYWANVFQCRMKIILGFYLTLKDITIKRLFNIFSPYKCPTFQTPNWGVYLWLQFIAIYLILHAMSLPKNHSCMYNLSSPCNDRRLHTMTRIYNVYFAKWENNLQTRFKKNIRALFIKKSASSKIAIETVIWACLRGWFLSN